MKYSVTSVRIFAIAVFLSVTRAAFATSWFVLPASRCANNGDGTVNACAASGSARGAWKGSANIAWALVKPGETVNFRGTWGATDCHDPAQYCVLVQKSGSVGNPITLDFTASLFDSNYTRAKAIATQSYSNLILKNLTATRFTAYGIELNGLGAPTAVLNVIIDAPTISYISGCSGECDGIWGKGANITVHNPRISQISDDGIWLDGDQSAVNFDLNDGTYYVKDVGLGPKITGDCFQFSGSGGYDANFVRKGYCDHRSVSEKHCVVSNSLGLVTVTDTVCLATPNSATTGIYSNGRLDVERNYLSGWTTGISAATLQAAAPGASTIAANIVSNFGTIGIVTSTATPSGVVVTVVNNTVDGANSNQAVSQCFSLGGAGTSVVYAMNNIAVNCRYAFFRSAGTGSKTLARNIDYGNVSPYYSFVAGSTTASPQFRGGSSPSNYYRLSPRSPALGAGACYWANGCASADYDGVGQAVPPSIGAFGGW